VGTNLALCGHCLSAVLAVGRINMEKEGTGTCEADGECRAKDPEPEPQPAKKTAAAGKVRLWGTDSIGLGLCA
jgi:hypothetical protein